MRRVVTLVDGFNLYHALDDLHRPELKWLDLWALSNRLIRPQTEELNAVYYFSALAYWRPDSMKRHKAYMRGLEAHRVTRVLGKFKDKDRRCPKCGWHWKGHEEKETDVNIAITLLRLAQKNGFDRCLLISRDSDLSPAVRTVRADFKTKEITIVAPPNRGHSTELIEAAEHDKAKITVGQLEQCQLPDRVTDVGGNLVAVRPPEYIVGKHP